MAKIVALNRKHLTLLLGVVLVFLVGMAAVKLWQKNDAPVAKTVAPEVKMVSVGVDPAGPTKDVTYGSVTLKGSQIIPAKVFDLTVTLQNVTDRKMTNVPVEMEMNLLGNDRQKVKQMANVPSLDPGGTVKVIFHQIHALGDAMGVNPTAGLHEITIEVKANPAGGVNEDTEAHFQFNVDSTVKTQAK
ncbi:Hypothetical protein DEACI_2526 [Acididesulfobacillus acetoxydans]|uniref:Uncharacterized protein n=1 Tax=Acididesulfobacillus acetoxydans TaxID=1561005 RepID=A0A8S0XC10_9FIRM|nr:hypothetical protein [Acididesulfobacillus acetoxydans]CAA7601856.1 Hypothetical protein DEACI_2526 [Acididesulfobacillus acetoxydans]CEJ08669.1 Hypothetical protein DEACI_3148 [Acididesulfobacillus acetoxydans]